LGELKIFKNLSPEEKIYIRAKLAEKKGTWSRLFFVGDVLFENPEIENLCKRIGPFDGHTGPPGRREVVFIDLPFDFDRLKQPYEFRNFQLLLFNARIHFEDSFARGIWAPDHRGLYGRSPTLQLELKKLTRQHNLIFDALKKFKVKDEPSAQALLQTARSSYSEIVNNTHHRQFPDILAILFMLYRAGKYEFQQSMRDNLLTLARTLLPENDPRRGMFECLEQLRLDEIGHYYSTFNTYCRHLWGQKVGDDYKAYYSFHQASFPRVPQGGFYSIYEGKSIYQIRSILAWSDTSLGMYSPETSCLWLTALNYLWDEGKTQDLISVGRLLCQRIASLELHRRLESQQLNLDGSVACFLLGRAEEADGRLGDAKDNYFCAVNLRNEIIASETWDPIRVASLERLLLLSLRVGDSSAWERWDAMLKRMYNSS
jgi:hypothetical protein